MSRMSAIGAVLVGLLVTSMLAGCLMVPGPRGEGMVVVPALPPVVVFDAGPYYVHQGYHYHYQNNGWYYARSRGGPWAPLPEDHYPREVKFRDGGNGRDQGRNNRHQDGNRGHQGR